MTVDVLTNLKNKAIEQLNKYISDLNYGYKDDYQFTLYIISFIQMYSLFDSKEIPGMYEMLMNYV